MSAAPDMAIAPDVLGAHSLHRLVVRWGRLQMRDTETILRMWSKWKRKAHNTELRRGEKDAKP